MAKFFLYAPATFIALIIACVSRYLLSPLKLKSATEEVLVQWQRIYGLLESGQGYSTVEV